MRAGRLALAGACLLAAGATLWSQQHDENRCALTLDLRDARTGARLAGLVRVTDKSGRPAAIPELLSRGLGLDGDGTIGSWSVIPGSGPARITLPRDELVITALSGLETELARLTVDLQSRSEFAVEIPLTRFYSPATRGWRSANTHLHLMKINRDESDRYLREVPAADGLDLLFVSYLERAGADHDYITNRYSADDLVRLGDGAGVLYGNGEEHRHNFSAQGEGYGHVMLLNLRQLVQPVSIGPGIMRLGTDGLPVQRGIDAARRQGGTAVWCHNHWGYENVPNWVLGRLDAQNIFDGGEHGSYKDSFYRFLNSGLRVPFSTGTDWFIYDFSRVYVPVAGNLTPGAWLKSLAAGKSFITNGPLLEFVVDGKPPGETVKLVAGGPVTVDAFAAGRSDFRQLELVRNGSVIETADSRPVAGHFEARARWTIDVREPCWLALRTPPPPVKGELPGPKPFPRNELGKPIFSHTSPVYVEVAGTAFVDPVALRDLHAGIETALDHVRRQAKFADEAERESVLQIYREAVAELRRRIGER